ncbi:MAG: hypothetical protein K9J27_04050 [Bacteroidales bacterium]|nr:hypothetical protein [Bacteroidales bacterium]
MIKLIVIAALLILIAVLALGFRIFFVKNGKFPETEIGHNREMIKRGIHCPRTMDIVERKACNSCSAAKTGCM